MSYNRKVEEDEAEQKEKEVEIYVGADDRTDFQSREGGKR